MPDDELIELATLARRLGYTREHCCNRLRRRIVRDQAYLLRRRRQGYMTSHDDTLAEDVAVTALVVLFLEGQVTL